MTNFRAVLVLAVIAAAALLTSMPEAAQAQTAVTLSALEINNVTTGDPGNLPAYFANSFRPDQDGYLVNVQKTVTSVTVTPTATAASGVTITVKLGEDDETSQTVASGAASTAITLTPNDDLNDPHNIFVTVTDSNVAANTKTYTISVYQFDPVAFTTTTVADRVYTVGAPAPNDAGTLCRRSPSTTSWKFPTPRPASPRDSTWSMAAAARLSAVRPKPPPTAWSPSP